MKYHQGYKNSYGDKTIVEYEEPGETFKIIETRKFSATTKEDRAIEAVNALSNKLRRELKERKEWFPEN